MAAAGELGRDADVNYRDVLDVLARVDRDANRSAARHGVDRRIPSDRTCRQASSMNAQPVAIRHDSGRAGTSR